MTISLPPPEGCGPRERGATNTRGFTPCGACAGGADPLFCLAPREVCRAPSLARRAVGSYPAISPLPRPFDQRRFVFCDTVCYGRLSPSVPAHSTRRVAFWCSDFPLPGGILRSLRERSSISRGQSARIARWCQMISVPPERDPEHPDHRHGNDEFSEHAEERAQQRAPTGRSRRPQFLARQD